MSERANQYFQGRSNRKFEKIEIASALEKNFYLRLVLVGLCIFKKLPYFNKKIPEKILRKFLKKPKKRLLSGSHHWSIGKIFSIIVHL